MKKNLCFCVLLWITLLFGLPAADDIIYSGSTFEPYTLDPAQVWDTKSSFFIQNIFDTLVSIDPRSNQVLPGLAVSWEVSADGLRWVFRLRKGVFFHDQTPLDSKAVVFSFQRQLDPELPGRPAESPLFGEIFGLLANVTALDDERVEFVLKAPYAPFLQALSVDCAAVVSPAAVRRLGKGFARQPVGSGPFRLESWEPERRLTMAANKHYWRGRPAMEGFVHIVENNQEILETMFQKKKLDILQSISISRLAAVRRMSWARVYQYPLLSPFYLAMNLDRPLFRDRRVRRAMNHLWDSRILTLVFQGQVTPLQTVLPIGFHGELGRGKGYEHSIDRALELLRAAGVKKEISLELIYTDIDPHVRQMLNFYSRNLRRAGIVLKMVKVSQKERFSRIASGNFDLSLSGWTADYPDPDSIISALLSPELLKKGFANISSVGRPELFTLMHQARGEIDEHERYELYRRIEKITNEEAALIPLYQQQVIIIHSKRIENLQGSPLGRFSLFGLRKQAK